MHVCRSQSTVPHCASQHMKEPPRPPRPPCSLHHQRVSPRPMHSSYFWILSGQHQIILRVQHTAWVMLRREVAKRACGMQAHRMADCWELTSAQPQLQHPQAALRRPHRECPLSRPWRCAALGHGSGALRSLPQLPNPPHSLPAPLRQPLVRLYSLVAASSLLGYAWSPEMSCTALPHAA